MLKICIERYKTCLLIEMQYTTLLYWVVKRKLSYGLLRNTIPFKLLSHPFELK